MLILTGYLSPRDGDQLSKRDVSARSYGSLAKRRNGAAVNFGRCAEKARDASPTKGEYHG